MTHAINYSIFIFTLLALLISSIFSKQISKSTKKHFIASLFILVAAFIHAFVIFMTT